MIYASGIMSELLTIFIISLIAGLGTGIGGLIAVIRKPGKRSFGFLMGFTAGVMITLSFLELISVAWELEGWMIATLGFGAGAFFMFLLDFSIPHMRFGETEIPEFETRTEPGINTPAENASAWGGRRRRRWHQNLGINRQNRIVDQRLFKSGILLLIGITIHNIPEGIAVGAGYMHTPTFGVFIALAIMLHNIPEGIATALPLCKSGVCKWDSFRAALLSGLVEPIGALTAAIFLTAFDSLIPFGLAFAGGVMMFITLDELIPTAREHGHQHYTALGIILGAIFVFVLSGLFGV